ncbi:hypothetical protein EDD70_1336 [Hydrogenoanaerobacterium saccharovorans]|uniref:Uncharacterized protein n=1 Tax=Hydrogenoanaerobacterium saccharovorans TaxID=474960 RepID=A0A1H7ZLW2_9FIRM|nr:hypothetical protein [Hydrogenoanaerobacterium saccharovorans]RPF48519.1 hypothetical protein EDD70_1336 [Hydrogenoanaerobacterium saccharovorans]SEM59253.1 hypothetical protein SAMN05216180_0754 [Hydrogenoanaerobacterium saccharovorans]
MREPVKTFNAKSLIICTVILVSIFLIEIVCAYAFVDDFSFNLNPPPATVSDDTLDKFSDMGIEIDPNAVMGMINPAEKTGTKKKYGSIAYKINVSPEFKDGTSAGNLMIENHGDNQHLIKVHIDTIDGETIYESGYIAPDMHIPSAPLDVELDNGTYEALATIEAFDIETQELIGALEKEIKIKIGK